MITLVCIGPGRGAKSGYSSKGYTIRRSGAKLIIQSGHIDAISRQFFWRYKNHPRVRSFTSPGAARIGEERLLARKLRKSQGYKRLPPSVRIKHRRRRASQSVA